MKARSPVWRFFDKIFVDGVCTGVLCKLCNTDYKFYGNTTNLKTHLLGKHPIQWDLSEKGSLDTSMIHFDDESNKTAKKRKFKDENVRYSMSIVTDTNSSNEDCPEAQVPHIEIHRIEGSDTECEDENGTVTLISQINENGEEEWLEDNFQNAHVEEYKPKYTRAKAKKEAKTLRPRSTSTYNQQRPSLRYENSSPIIINDSNPRKDEYSVFGEYIGEKLRKIPNTLIKNNVQQLITTVLWQAEFGMYDDIEAVKKVFTGAIQLGSSQNESHIETDVNGAETT